MISSGVPIRNGLPSRRSIRRSQYWLANYSLGFSKKEWDAVVIHPSVAEPGKAEPDRDDLVRKLVAAHDLSLIDREKGDERNAGEILGAWVKEQAAVQRVEN